MNRQGDKETRRCLIDSSPCLLVSLSMGWLFCNESLNSSCPARAAARGGSPSQRGARGAAPARMRQGAHAVSAARVRGQRALQRSASALKTHCVSAKYMLLYYHNRCFV